MRWLEGGQAKVCLAMTAPDSERQQGSMPAWRKYALVPAALAVACLCAVALSQMPLGGQPTMLLQKSSSPPGREAMTTMLEGEGMTYMPSSASGISDHDASPTMDTKFYQEEDRSARRMKKLKLLLTVHPLTQQQQAGNMDWEAAGVGQPAREG